MFYITFHPRLPVFNRSGLQVVNQRRLEEQKLLLFTQTFSTSQYHINNGWWHFHLV